MTIGNFDGGIGLLAGNGASGATDGFGLAVTFASPSGLAIDANGNIFVTDVGNSAIRKIAPDGSVSTYARPQSLSAPIAVDTSGNVYTVAFPQSIQCIDPKGNITTFPVPQITDFITALVADNKGALYAGTRGIGAQIVKFTF